MRCCKFGLPCEKYPVVGKKDCFEEVNTAAADLIERLTAENAALREKQRWIPVTERPPEPETEVLAVCNRNGYIFVIPAIYEDGKMLTRDSAWNWSDIYCYGLYDEEADDYYIPEGWWENRKFNPDDVYNNPVDCAVTNWMPMPEVPKEEKSISKAVLISISPKWCQKIMTRQKTVEVRNTRPKGVRRFQKLVVEMIGG